MKPKKDYVLFLFSSDIQLLTGRGPKYAQRMITQVWDLKKMPKQRWIIILDFCNITGLSEEIVQTRLALLRANLT
jgi:NADH:ubiquinone oxidoreductase subunit B-like Fe-S oxidoreductase